MLYQLHQYAVSEGLSSKPGYARKNIKAIITLSADGGLLSAEPAEVLLYAPTLSQPELIAGGQKRSHFLADSMATVTGTGDAKTAEKHKAFVGIHQQAAGEVHSLAPLAAALTNDAVVQEMARRLTEHKIRPTDIVTFRLEGSDRCLIEHTDWRGWWDAYRAGLVEKKVGGQMRCFVTGALVDPVKTHPKIALSRVDGQTTGSTLIGFDKESFSSYGLEQSCNAACSEESAAVYAGALNHLIRKAPQPLANTLMLHWLDRLVPAEDDPFGLLPGMSEAEEEGMRLTAMETARQLAEAARSGARPDLTHNRYHVILMSGAAGRAMVRSAFEGQLTDLYAHISSWFEDLTIVAPRGHVAADVPRLFVLLTRMLPYRPGASAKDLREEMDKQLPPLVTRIWDSILQSVPFPQQGAYRALQNLKSRLLRAREDDRDHGLENIDRVAVAMLKLWYNRAIRSGLLESGGAIVGIKLDTEHPAPAYHAGRLLAVLNHLQHAALNDVNADVVQRFFSAASVTPGLVIGRLIEGAQPHLNKLRKGENTKGRYVWYQQTITEIASHLDDDVLKQLDFAGQTLFALGYYHQSAALFEGRKTKDENEED